MATIRYLNNDFPISPGIEEVFDTSPVIGAISMNLFELVNNNDGPLKNVKVQLHSDVNGTGNFSYAFGPFLPSGTITGMTVRAPNGAIILEVEPGASGFLNSGLTSFFNLLTNPNATPAAAISTAILSLVGNSNTIQGSAAANNLKAIGSSVNGLFGGGGNDVLWAPGAGYRRLVGGGDDDLIRVERGSYEIHGDNSNGTGGDGEIDTVEIVGYVNSPSHAFFTKFTNIDILRFVAADQPAPGSADGASIGAAFNLTEIGAANLPSALTVHGSSAASPQSKNFISIFAPEDITAATGMAIDLSGWTFKTWNQKKNEVHIATNRAQKPLDDIVTGSMVADDIRTYDGNDTIRGGGGADQLYGGNGSDTFVFGLNEAAPGEFVDGGNGNDTVLVRADNDFSGVRFDGVQQLKLGKATAIFERDIVGNPSAIIIGDGNANTVVVQLKAVADKVPAADLSGLTFKSWTKGVDKIVLKGTTSQDIIIGSSQGDRIAGGDGRDILKGGKGADAFVFDAAFGKGVSDRIADFSRKQGDRIELDLDVFAKLKSAVSKGSGVLKKSAFEIGSKADDRKDRILYDKKSGALRYDGDGSGKHKAQVIAVLDDSPTLKAGDIFVI